MIYSSFFLLITSVGFAVTIIGHTAPRAVKFGTIGDYQHIEIFHKEGPIETENNRITVDGYREEGDIRITIKYKGDYLISPNNKITDCAGLINLLQRQNMLEQRHNSAFSNEDKISLISTLIRHFKHLLNSTR